MRNYSAVVKFAAVGNFFGYPDCCVGEFIAHYINDTIGSRESRKFNGSGYIPCTSCNEKSEKDIVDSINQNRSENLPAFTGTPSIDCLVKIPMMSRKSS